MKFKRVEIPVPKEAWEDYEKEVAPSLKGNNEAAETVMCKKSCKLFITGLAQTVTGLEKRLSQVRNDNMLKTKRKLQ